MLRDPARVVSLARVEAGSGKRSGERNGGKYADWNERSGDRNEERSANGSAGRRAKKVPENPEWAPSTVRSFR